MTKSSSAPKPHKQVLAKVNAYVDEDIKELVEVLNTLGKLWTFESCQRNGANRGWVLLNYGDEDTGQDEIIEFTKALIASVRNYIKEYPNGLLGDTFISLEWVSSSPKPYMYITFPSDATEQITSVFRNAVLDFQGSNPYR